MATLVVVPDASVILKWVLPPATESDVRHALALRDAIATGSVRALVPTLWIYEVGNLLARERPGEASRLLDVLVRFGLADAPRSPAWLGCVLKLTKRYGVTFYDAAYHAHAIVERGVLVTADERYVDRARTAGFVVRLSEWDDGAPARLRNPIG